MKVPRSYNFGEFSLYLDDKTLWRGEENISITPKMYELLLVLVQNPDRVVEKEYLLRTVWPDSFVEEGNITFNIRQLRKALGDDAQSPAYIETIPRRGYRFVAKVTRPEPEIKTVAATAADASKEEKRFQPRLILTLMALIILLFAMGFAIWYSRNSAVAGAPILAVPFSSEKLSTDGQVFHAALTPDGKTMVYTHGAIGKQSLWIRQLETSNNVQIVPPSDNFYGGLAISPDGGKIYFTRGAIPTPTRQIDVYRMPIVGGVPQKLVEATQGWISVSRDGQKLSFIRCYYRDEDYCSLWTADAAGGNEKMIASHPRPIRMADNEISPDGTTVAFATGQSRTASNEFELHAVDIESGQERQLTPEKFFVINYIAWLPDQSGLLITAKRLPDRNSRIWYISASTGEARALTDDAETYFRLGLDKEARLLVSTRVEPDFRLNIFQTDNPEAPPHSLSNASTATFAPNGKIVFSSVMTGDNEIWSINPDGSDQRQLTSSPADDIAPIVSPDGVYIYFDSNRSGQVEVWRMNMDGSNPAQMTTEEGGFPLTVSPDGQWLYYRSALKGTLRRVSTADRREELVYNPEGKDFAISPDAARILIADNASGEWTFRIVSLADLKEGAFFRPPDPLTHPIYTTWSRDGHAIAYAVSDDVGQNRSIWLQPLEGGKPRQLLDQRMGQISELSGFSLSYDAKQFALIQGTWNHNAVLIKGLKAGSQ